MDAPLKARSANLRSPSISEAQQTAVWVSRLVSMLPLLPLALWAAVDWRLMSRDQRGALALGVAGGLVGLLGLPAWQGRARWPWSPAASGGPTPSYDATVGTGPAPGPSRW